MLLLIELKSYPNRIYLKSSLSHIEIIVLFFLKIKMEPKHTLLVALGEITGEDYVLETLKKTKAR